MIHIKIFGIKFLFFSIRQLYQNEVKRGDMLVGRKNMSNMIDEYLQSHCHPTSPSIRYKYNVEQKNLLCFLKEEMSEVVTVVNVQKAHM